ncbi:MAG: aldo/keto reductase [Tissierellia bacterium]|nr:aldo/keto reductase [Tissierellia bacterium]
MRELGKTGIHVSRLCFGSLTMTPFQANLSVEEGASLIKEAYDLGVNFIDTAEIYDNYPYIRRALETIPREKFVIATKCYAYDKKTATESLQKALKELGTDYIDVFLLHEQESIHTLRGHDEALKTFAQFKKEGYIRAVGISSHFVNCVKAAKKWEEIDLVHPILNMAGIGIQDGSTEDMLEAISDLHQSGIGIYTMKALGGGHLISRQEEALRWILAQKDIDAVAVGMQRREEVHYNTGVFFHGTFDEDLQNKIKSRKRKLVVADYCIGCGRCVDRCKQKGIQVIDGKAQANSRCILCGYCATTCPEFCIKVV